MGNVKRVVTTATKEQFLKKHIQEFDRIIQYAQALKDYAKAVLMEDSYASDGVCDGMNDPENRRPRKPAPSAHIYDHRVLPTEHAQHNYNHFVKLDCIGEMFKKYIESTDTLEFPAEFFPENKSTTKVIDVEKSEESASSFGEFMADMLGIPYEPDMAKCNEDCCGDCSLCEDDEDECELLTPIQIASILESPESCDTQEKAEVLHQVAYYLFGSPEAE